MSRLKNIIEERAKGDYKSFGRFHFTGGFFLNSLKKSLEPLVKSGSLDNLGYTRKNHAR
ncbi:hypothetical protein LUA77_07555 [Helicobacter pylori]|nr:hypothetical protein LUA77_07555 [Helicobacter pylori]